MRSVREGGVSGKDSMQVLEVNDGWQGQSYSQASYQENPIWSLSLNEIIKDGSGRTVTEILEEKHPDASPA